MPGPDLDFFVYPKKPSKKKDVHPPCRICHELVQKGNLVMTVSYDVSSGITACGFYHWRCVERRAEEAGILSDERFFQIRDSLLEGGPLFPPSKG